MDDFLFDPWSADGVDAGAPPAEATEEEPAPEEAAPAEARPGTKSPRRWTVRSEPTEAPNRPSRPPSFHSIPDHPRLPGEEQPPLVAKRLRSMVVSRIEEMATRLRAARHRTFLDDRLDRSQPVLRFRLIPWEGPFDEAPAVAGSVFELALAEPDVVVARRWLDPVAETPEVEVRVAAEKLDRAWIDGQLMAFVEESLRRG